VAVSGWLISSHRDVALDLALSGEGVVRLTDFTILPHVRGGRLVPVLLEWEMPDAPPLHLLYRPNQRRNPRVRLFVDFITEVFGEIDAERGGASQHTERPRWWARRGRASAAIERRG
jgi:DNA-binding transcriptional LysR family regulator